MRTKRHSFVKELTMDTSEMIAVDNTHTSYDRLRRIGNLRFDLKPMWMCFCFKPEHVYNAFSVAREYHLPVRIRAGGHHHEGMCSGDDVCVIDVSGIDHVVVDAARHTLRVGPGAKNSTVYTELWNANPRQLFSGGGCGDVRVGGLTQGGGWGPYARSLGMTCDKLDAFSIVFADASEPIRIRRADAKYADLFKAVCGGGGGNFGVVTEFEFETEDAGELTQFTATWRDRVRRPEVIQRWMEAFPIDDNKNHTSFCRVSVIDPKGDPKKQAPVVVAGNYRGDIDATYAFLLDRLGSFLYAKAEMVVEPVHKAEQVFSHPQYQPVAPPPGVDLLLLPDLSNTCLGRGYPHRVSSCFPTATFGKKAIEMITQYFYDIEEKDPVPDSRRYLSLHCMGGQIKANGDAASSFAWRDKPFMLQYQGWWIKPGDEDAENACMQFVKEFRDRMHEAEFTEGSFINFPDRDIDLPEYYRDKYDDLIAVKNKYDRFNFFDFEMGIPLKR